METRVNRLMLASMLVAAWSGGGLGCNGETSLVHKIPQAPGAAGAGNGEGSGNRTGTGGAGGSAGVNGAAGSAEVTGIAGTTGEGGTTDAAGTTGTAGTGGAGGIAGSSASGTAGSTGAGGTMGAAGRAGAGGSNGGGGGSAGAGGSVVNDGPIQVLVWNNALTYGHAARVNAIPYFKAREATDNIKFDTTFAHTGTATDGPIDTSFDASVFTDAGLDRYDVVMFLDTTGNTIDDGQTTVRRQALQDFILKKGRGFVGTHSATDTYQGTNWPWYVDFIGANFLGHGAPGTPGTAKYNQNMTHPILTAAGTPNPWNRSEEWYTFTRDPLASSIPGIKILLTCHDQSVATERASAWIHEMPLTAGAPRAGRMFYTAMGHATSAFMEKAFMDLVINGIKWAAYRIN